MAPQASTPLYKDVFIKKYESREQIDEVPAVLQHFEQILKPQTPKKRKRSFEYDKLDFSSQDCNTSQPIEEKLSKPKKSSSLITIMMTPRNIAAPTSKALKIPSPLNEE